jgi:hypothetical protein
MPYIERLQAAALPVKDNGGPARAGNLWMKTQPMQFAQQMNPFPQGSLPNA